MSSMDFAVHEFALRRIQQVLDFFFPSKVFEFRTVLIETHAHVMGSLPLFSLRPNWPTWQMPGDVDIFFRPPGAHTQDDFRLFDDFLTDSGYWPRSRALIPYFLGLCRSTGFSVLTYTKPMHDGDRTVQLIIHYNCGNTHEREWYMNVMQTFDISCCSVSYNGRAMFVTPDNADPTGQRAFVRHNNNTTPQRVIKYRQRGFVFE